MKFSAILEESMSLESYRKFSKKFFDKLPEDIRISISHYSGMGSRAVNMFLTSGNAGSGWPKDLLKKIIKDIESISQNNALKNSIVVFKGVKYKPKVGESLKTPGFISTSVSKEIAESFAGSDGTVIMINLPIGTKAFPIPNSEFEMLLSKQYQIKIIKYDKNIAIGELK